MNEWLEWKCGSLHIRKVRLGNKKRSRRRKARRKGQEVRNKLKAKFIFSKEYREKVWRGREASRCTELGYCYKAEGRREREREARRLLQN